MQTYYLISVIFIFKFESHAKFLFTEVVVICSINHGMFIVRPKWDSINRLVESGATMAQQTRTREGAMSGEAYCPLRTESKTCAAPKLC